MNQGIRDAALALAEQLLNSPEYITMQEAEEAALQDEALQGEYRAYAQLRNQLQEQMMMDQPDDEKVASLNDELERTQVQLQAMGNMEALSDARNAFSDLMAEVNGLLEDVLSPMDEEEDDDEFAGGCGSGGCAGCSGCGPER